MKFELTEQTRQALDDYMKAAHKQPGEFLFADQRSAERSLTTRRYARPNALEQKANSPHMIR